MVLYHLNLFGVVSRFPILNSNLLEQREHLESNNFAQVEMDVTAIKKEFVKL